MLYQLLIEQRHGGGIKSDERKPLVLERKLLRKIFGPIEGEPSGEWRISNNYELKTLFHHPTILEEIRNKRLQWPSEACLVFKYYFFFFKTIFVQISLFKEMEWCGFALLSPIPRGCRPQDPLSNSCCRIWIRRRRNSWRLRTLEKL